MKKDTLKTETLELTIDGLGVGVAQKRRTLNEALTTLDQWVEQNAPTLTDEDRMRFSEVLQTEKEPETRDGESHGDDRSLALSILRLHAMRLLYRFDEGKRLRTELPPTDESDYERAKRKLETALRQTELAMNEARIDTAIANAQGIFNDRNANRHWLNQALKRLQPLAQRDLLALANAIPAPEPPSLGIVQRLTLWVLRIKSEEIVRRNLNSLRQLAELQTQELAEMVVLLRQSFESIKDTLGVEQAQTLLKQLGVETEPSS